MELALGQLGKQLMLVQGLKHSSHWFDEVVVIFGVDKDIIQTTNHSFE